ncbi:unnamed protein product [Arabidopsis lyrata]|nr:unnamed protein product [Arabidopsis lyrata]
MRFRVCQWKLASLFTPSVDFVSSPSCGFPLFNGYI